MTGGNRGIGKAFSYALAQAGSNVAMIYRLDFTAILFVPTYSSRPFQEHLKMLLSKPRRFKKSSRTSQCEYVVARPVRPMNNLFSLVHIAGLPMRRVRL